MIIITDILKRTWAEIHLDRIKNNILNIKNILDEKTMFMAVVKADAYGHGAVPVSLMLDNMEAVNYFGVSNIEEGLQIRKAGTENYAGTDNIGNDAGVKKPILILGYTPCEYAKEILAYNLSQTIFSFEQAKALQWTLGNKGKIKIHIKIDTGMSRLGFVYNDTHIKDEIKKITKMDCFDCEGIYTHFAKADDIGSNYTKIQYDRFVKLIDELEADGIKFKIKHAASSGAVLNFPSTHMDMVRPGLIMYGLSPNPSHEEPIELIPAMELRTVISQIKDIEENTFVSYDCTYKSDGVKRIATLPIGYADGYLRALSNNGEILINGNRASVVGRVCMDQCMIDVTGIDGVKQGQEVTVFGSDENGKTIKIDEIAKKSETINYEIICLIGKRVGRIYYEDGKKSGVLNYLV